MLEILRTMKIENLENELVNNYEDYRDYVITYETYKRNIKIIHKELELLRYYEEV